MSGQSSTWLVEVPSLIAESLVVNEGLELWTAGTSVAPDGWALSGTGATVAKNVTNFHGGLASASLTRVTADAFLSQNLATTARPMTWWRGRLVTVFGWVRATVASRAQLFINDGIGGAQSAFHSGGSSFTLLDCTARISPFATQLLVGLQVVTGNTTAQIDDVFIHGYQGRYAMMDLDVLANFYNGQLIDDPRISRRMQDSRWGPVETQRLTVTLANVNGELLPAYQNDLRNEVIVLKRCDVTTESITTEWTGTIADVRIGRDALTIEGEALDMSMLEEDIPKGGLINLIDYPLADSGAVGHIAPWLFGTVYGLPLLNVRDDDVNGIYDYLICRGQALTCVSVKRVGQSGDTFPVEPEECNALDIVQNNSFERWDAGSGGPPSLWTLTGAGATATRNTTAADVMEGFSSVNLTRAGGADTRLEQRPTTVTAEPIEAWQGRTVRIACWAKTATAGCTAIAIEDDSGSTLSSNHSGGGGWELLEATRTISASATFVDVGCVRHAVNGTSTFDSFRVMREAISWEDAIRTDIYPGYSALRFFLRQDDSNDNLYRVTADVNVESSTANPARALRTIIEDATHGLGHTCDSTTFAAAEDALCTHYRDVVLLDDPELFLDFEDDPLSGTVATDSSAHLRHGTYVGTMTRTGSTVTFNGSQDGHVLVPWAPWMDTDGITVEIWYTPPNTFGVAQTIPVLSKRRNNTEEEWQIDYVRPASSGNAGNINVNLWCDDGASGTIEVGGNITIPWADISGQVANHIAFTYSSTTNLLIYRNGVLAHTESGTGADAILTGYGGVYMGDHADPSATQLPWGIYDRVAVYNYVMPAADLLNHFNSKLLNSAPSNSNGGALMYDSKILALTPGQYWVLGETSGTTATDSSGGGFNATYTGSPTLNVPGPMVTTLRDPRGAVEFTSDIARFVVRAGLTGGNSATSVCCWYRPHYVELGINSGIVEKTIGGTVNTQWLLFQEGYNLIWRLVTGAGQFTLSFPLDAVDQNTWLFLAATFASGTMRLYKNGVEVGSLAYTGTPSTGAGDLYIGKLGSGASYPCHGDIGRVAVSHTAAWTASQISGLLVDGTWRMTGYDVAAALMRPQQAQEVIRQLCHIRGMRLSVNSSNHVTVAADVSAAPAPTLALGDGPGDGPRNLLVIEDRQRPPAADAIKTLVIRYRRDLLNDGYLFETRRSIGTTGREWVIEMDVIRDHTTADRVAAYIAARLADEETVTVEVALSPDEAVSEGDLVTLTHPTTGYDAATMEVIAVDEGLTSARLVLSAYSTDRYTYVAQALPVGGVPG